MSYPPPQYHNLNTRGVAFSATKAGAVDGTKYRNLDELHAALEESGFEACEMIVGLDFTKSNKWNGKQSFGGRSLHAVGHPPNPYITALQFAASKLKLYDDDQQIPCYGFGDVSTGGDAVFSFFPGNTPARGLNDLLKRYEEIAPKVDLFGPTSFAPLIRQAMRDVYESEMKFHILLIIGDGGIADECVEETKKAIAEAAFFPMSIIMIGVGDGPWDMMQQFDDVAAPERPFDNFQFVQLTEFIAGPDHAIDDAQADKLEMEILEELPRQYTHARTLKDKASKDNVQRLVEAIPAEILMNPPSNL